MAASRVVVAISELGSGGGGKTVCSEVVELLVNGGLAVSSSLSDDLQEMEWRTWNLGC